MAMTQNHDFLARVQEQLRELRAQEEQLGATMEGLSRKRDELLQRIDARERSLAVYREVMGIETEHKPQLGLFGEVQSGTIAEMAETLIVHAGGQARVGDIVRALTEQGKLNSGSGRGGYGTVYSILHRDKRFRKAGPGAFTLAEFPARATNGQQPRE